MRWTGRIVMATALAGAMPVAAQTVGDAGPPGVDTVRVPVLGSSALDSSFHDPSLYAPDPLPIETGAALDALVVDQIPRAELVGPAGAERSPLDRVERGGIGRLARKIGGDEVVVPVWTLHLGGGQ